MKSSELNKFLFTDFARVGFKALIENEVSSYEKLMKKKGSSNRLIFEEDQELVISESAIKKLLEETLSGNLSNVDLAYICDCLTLGEKVIYKNEKAEDLVFAIADPEINGGFKTRRDLERMIDSLIKEG